jgi:hypothetical protein
MIGVGFFFSFSFTSLFQDDQLGKLSLLLCLCTVDQNLELAASIFDCMTCLIFIHQQNAKKNWVALSDLQLFVKTCLDMGGDPTQS